MRYAVVLLVVACGCGTSHSVVVQRPIDESGFRSRLEATLTYEFRTELAAAEPIYPSPVPLTLQLGQAVCTRWRGRGPDRHCAEAMRVVLASNARALEVSVEVETYRRRVRSIPATMWFRGRTYYETETASVRRYDARLLARVAVAVRGAQAAVAVRLPNVE